MKLATWSPAHGSRCSFGASGRRLGSSTFGSRELLLDVGTGVEDRRHFRPLEFQGRLAVVVPRPRINLTLDLTVLAPRAVAVCYSAARDVRLRWRRRVGREP